VDYLKQQRYLDQSRVFSGCVAAAVLLMAGICLLVSGRRSAGVTMVFGLVTVALAISLCYVPNYLHLTVNPQKRLEWAVKVRWRIAGAAAILGLLLTTTWLGRVALPAAVAWLLIGNLAAKKWVPTRYASTFSFGSELVLVSICLLTGFLDPLMGTILLAAATHLWIVTCDHNVLRQAFMGIAWSWLVIGLAFYLRGGSANSYVALEGLILIAGLATAWAVRRAEEQNSRNSKAAMRELRDFTGYSTGRIQQLWAISNQELARNWQKAAIAGDDRERLAQWYRDNSELYLFAISGYNLEYKRILSNLKVLKLARGACLDYGAGNGEIILELARRGHPATYYDVDGVTMRFARQRASQQGLSVDFFHTKNDLAEAAQQRSFDTIFSFDVLEHLPDLPGELDFLASHLSPSGLLVFDVPAGSTKAHPMHLNHHLDVFAYMRAKGLRDERGLSLRLPFKKEEKFVYRKPVQPARL
jgi:2-polyprenyl-3-methyl-5-hydroxy-6-metoxy-1,4-benzoquinol methylase